MPTHAMALPGHANACHGMPIHAMASLVCHGMPMHATGQFSKTSRPKPVSKPKATRKRFVHKLPPGHQRIDCEASGAPIRITLTSSRTAHRVKHSVRNLLHSGLRVGHVLLWFDWMQSMTLPLVHEATSAYCQTRSRRIFLTAQKTTAIMRDCRFPESEPRSFSESDRPWHDRWPRQELLDRKNPKAKMRDC